MLLMQHRRREEQAAMEAEAAAPPPPPPPARTDSDDEYDAFTKRANQIGAEYHANLRGKSWFAPTPNGPLLQRPRIVPPEERARWDRLRDGTYTTNRGAISAKSYGQKNFANLIPPSEAARLHLDILEGRILLFTKPCESRPQRHERPIRNAFNRKKPPPSELPKKQPRF
jgi:hypothetical protein